MPLHVSSQCAHHLEAKIAVHSLCYNHIYRCDDTRGCVMQFWPPDDEHICSKHAEAWNKLIVKQKLCASCWLITEINIPRCTVSKTSKQEVCPYNMVSDGSRVAKKTYGQYWVGMTDLFTGTIHKFKYSSSRVALPMQDNDERTHLSC